MISTNDLTAYLHDFLHCALYKDYAPNGLQIEGREKIGRLCTAVTASEEAIDQALEWQADALLVHHGYFWRGEELSLSGMKRRRISKLLQHNMNLFAYHLPLDCHLELGNNACLAKLFVLESIKSQKAANIENLLWSGSLVNPMDSQEFTAFLESLLKQKPLHIKANNNKIRSIAWCSGAAQDLIEDAYQLGVDAYLSGEVSERTYYQAKELGIHYYSCGHHATERYGVQALGEHLARNFELEHRFIDSSNPV